MAYQIELTEIQEQLIEYCLENLTRTAANIIGDAVNDLVWDCPEAILLRPIFDMSEFWPQRIATEILGLDPDQQFTLEELVLEFERRERNRVAGSRSPICPDDPEQVDWPREGLRAFCVDSQAFEK